MARVSSQQGGIGPVPSIDAFAPAYGQPLSGPPVSGLGDNGIAQRGFYVQDQMRKGPWSPGLTVRHDRAQQRQPAGDLLLRHRHQHQDHLQRGNAVPGAERAGTLLKPDLGRQFKAGLKYRSPGIDTLLTVSVFDLCKNNSPTFDPFVIGPVSQIGEVRTRGPEFEARAALTKQLKLVASYTLLDAKFTQSLNPAEIGKQPLNTARQTASPWLDYRFGSPAPQGWSVGGGRRHVGKVPASTDNSSYNPP